MAEQEEDRVILHGKPSAWVVENYYNGMQGKPAVAVISHEERLYSALAFYTCTDVCVDTVRLLNGGGMGILPIHCKNVTVRRYMLCHDEHSFGLIANAADAIHAVACSGTFHIEDSVFEGEIDDALNVHNNFYRVVSAEKGYFTVQSPDTDLNTFCECFLPGDIIGIQRGKTMERTAQYTLERVEIVDEQIARFYVKEDISAHEAGDSIENLSAHPEVTIQNCVFGKSNSHIRLQTRGKTVLRDCKIGVPILLTGDVSYWYESGPIQDLTFTHCEFVNEKAQIRLMPEFMPSEAKPYYHENIRVVDSTFVTEVPITGGYADKITFCGNVNTQGKEMTLDLTNCGEVTAEHCNVKRHTEVKTELKRN